MKLRLSGFVFAIALLAALIVWAAITSSQRVEDSRAQLTRAQSESSRIARQFQEAILRLNEHLLSFAFDHETKQWVSFEQEWEALNRWIDLQHLSAPAEKQVLNQINTAFDDYHDAAQRIESRMNSRTNVTLPISEFARFQSESGRLLNLSFQLAEAHRQTLIASLAGSQKALVQLQVLLLGALFVLLGFGVWLAVVVYRHLIAPLQVKLVEHEALLERQEKLASLGVLAAGVAHEIRNPLTAINAWLFMHQRKLSPATQEFADAELVAKELHRLERIVKDFLLFARPSEPQFEAVPAQQLLADVTELLRHQLEKAGLHLILEPSPALWVRVDAHQMKQVLINLVQNAADAMGDEGTVTLRARLERKRLADREAEMVVLEVADTGKGIPIDVEKRLFDPFFTTKESGTGLGLSIAARIVEKHHGTLQYQTKVNYGTTFGILLERVGPP